MASALAGEGFADFSENKRLHHFYNAELLEKREIQISIASNAKFGLFDTLEIGGNALALVAGLPNLAVKHRMFQGDRYKTALSSHIFMLSAGGSASSGGETDDENTTSEREGSGPASTAFFGALGILTTHQLNSGSAISWGLYDLLAFGDLPLFDIDLSAHFLSPTLSYDLIISRRFGLSLALLYPFYVHGTLNSAAAQLELNTHTIGNNYGRIFMQGFATATYSIGVFNIEFGYARMFKYTIPYFNLFWRF